MTFKLIRPFRVSDLSLVSSSVGDGEYLPWDDDTAYAVGDTRTVTNRSAEVTFGDVSHVYVANLNADTLSQYSRNTSTGLLTALSPATIATGDGPDNATLSPDGLHVYVVNFNADTLSQYSRNSSTGLLTALTPATIATGDGPNEVTLSPDGLHVYVLNFNADTLSQYSRNSSTGLLTALTPATIATGGGPNEVILSPDGLHVYVVNSNADTLSMYSRNSSTGLLTALTPATIATGGGPNEVTLSPDGLHVYVVNFDADTLSMYSRNSSTGLLTALTPATIATGDGPFGITLSPDGLHVYVTNSNADTLSMYSRNSSTGLLTALTPATIATGDRPFGITLSPDGLHVYVVNFNADTLSQYSRDNSTGLLTALTPATIATGDQPTEGVVTGVSVSSTIYWPAHGRINGDMVGFHVAAGALPTGPSENFPYFVINKTDDTFQVSLTAGGAAVAFSGTATAPVYCDAFGESLIAPVTMTLSTTTRVAAIFTQTGHGWQNGQTGRLLTSGTLYTPLSNTQLYYIVGRTDDTFKLSTTLGGAPIKTSGTQSGTHYFVADSHHDYECLKAVTGTSNNTPPHKLTAEYLGGAETATWLDLGQTNRWACFDTSLTTKTEMTDRLTYVIQTSGPIDSLYLGNVEAAEVVLTVRAANGGAILYGPNTTSLVDVTDWVDLDIPLASDQELTVAINNVGNTVRVGAIVVGESFTIGTTLMGVKFGISDYSYKAKDDFGNYSFVERAFAKTADFSILLAAANVDATIAALSEYRAMPIVYVGTSGYSSAIVLGVYNSFDIVVDYIDYSMCNLAVEGLT